MTLSNEEQLALLQEFQARITASEKQKEIDDFRTNLLRSVNQKTVIEATADLQKQIDDLAAKIPKPQPPQQVP